MANAQRRTLIAGEDGREALNHLSQVLGDHYNVLATCDPRRALGWLENDSSVTVIVVEQVLKSGLGLDILESAKVLRPDVRRVLITRYSDLSGIVQGLHSGAINRMISKPLLRGELAAAVGSQNAEFASRAAN